MLLKIVSGLLTVAVAFLSVRHGWTGLTASPKPGEADLMTTIGINSRGQVAVHLLTLASGVMLLFPRTFFWANLISVLLFVVLIAFALDSHALKIALTEVPFLVLTLVLIWLGHPLRS